MLSRVPAACKRALRPLRTRAGEHPVLVPLVLRLTMPAGEDQRLTADTGIVIEGFPRSGNSFASSAFGLATGFAIRRSSNTHLAGQVRLAVKRGLPTLILIRRPVDAVASLCVAAPYLSARAGMREWIRFYRAVESVRDKVLLATFDEVTVDFGAVMARVNERFGTDFAAFEHNAATVEAVQRQLDEYGVRKRGYLREESIARPSSARTAANEAVRAALADPACAPLVATAAALYEQLVSQ